ncbi:MotA/TolQ/ExbB proton channel family protein [Ferrimonas balearica]|uniref:MotA/TolQ/ExbB proton channel family protein n=1 Tax=Ferrimonas balearica TaxID=44012 RepID=UPI001C9976A1|nr:MotA/TolQ/ExbB proton channel family protein [Ferrimonas balearica]MBY5921154.1 MotA/TolQ/ExbB proton channel family protein [Ferrimonas balearica]MBY5996161.1 MotA/TolQ/ExbB proton channel family protein [Ferrimonas balearica]
MKKIISTAFVAAALTFSAAPMAAEQTPAQTLDQLLNQIKQSRQSEARINKQREAEFVAERADKQKLLRDAKAALAAEKQRGEDLATSFTNNDQEIDRLSRDLATATGDLGEMFGVVRQVSGDMSGQLNASLVSAQFPGRDDFMAELASAKELPTIKELEELWIALQTEMTQSGKVVKFNAEVIDPNGNVSEQAVTRVGNFTLLDAKEYLTYNTETGTIQRLAKQPEGFKVRTVGQYSGSSAGQTPLFVDPSRGALLAVYTQKATLEEQFHQGGTVGYIIAGLLGLGVLISLYKIITLTLESAKIRAQVKNVDNPGNNALGRILKTYQENKNVDVETLELKIDEAILKETPRIESGVNMIKVMAAISPMLGLLGTVTGMIETFQNITLFGTGDPKIMAGGISMALVTTVLGLVAALPLLLMHALVAGRAKSVVEVIEEQSAGIIATHAEQRGK